MGVQPEEGRGGRRRVSEMKPILFSSTSLQRALLAAASHFGIEPDEVEYNLRDRGGAIRGGSKVVIEVDPERPRKTAPVVPRPPEPRPAPPAVPERRAEPGTRAEGRRAPAAPRPVERPRGPRTLASGPLAEAVAEAAGKLLALAGLEAHVILYEGEGALELELEGPDQALLVGGEGELLEALGHLVPRVARGLTGEPIAVRLDSAGYREAHEARLRALAFDRAEQARRSGRPVVLEEMNPADRRIVHLALADEADVETESRGEGFMKRISILPKKSRQP